MKINWMLVLRMVLAFAFLTLAVLVLLQGLTANRITVVLALTYMSVHYAVVNLLSRRSAYVMRILSDNENWHRRAALIVAPIFVCITLYLAFGDYSLLQLFFYCLAVGQMATQTQLLSDIKIEPQPTTT